MYIKKFLLCKFFFISKKKNPFNNLIKKTNMTFTKDTTVNTKELSTKELKNFMLLHKCLKFKKVLSNNIVLFFLYDFLTPTDRFELRKSIENQNFQSFILFNKTSKITLASTKTLKNILKSNILVVTPNNNNIIDNNIYKKILSIKKLNLISVIFNNKVLRPNEFETLLTLKSDIKTETFFNINNKINSTKKTLSFIKYNL